MRPRREGFWGLVTDFLFPYRALNFIGEGWDDKTLVPMDDHQAANETVCFIDDRSRSRSAS